MIDLAESAIFKAITAGGIPPFSQEQQDTILAAIPARDPEDANQILDEVHRALNEFSQANSAGVNLWHTRKHINSARKDLEETAERARALRKKIQFPSERIRLLLTREFDLARPNALAIVNALETKSLTKPQEGSRTERLRDLNKLCEDLIEWCESALDALPRRLKRGPRRKRAERALVESAGEIWTKYTGRSASRRGIPERKPMEEARNQPQGFEEHWSLLHFVQVTARIVDPEFNGEWLVNKYCERQRGDNST